MGYQYSLQSRTRKISAFNHNTKKNIINYLKHILELPDTTIVKQALFVSRDLHRNGKESFYSNAMNMLKPYYSKDDETTNIEIALRNIDTKTIVNRKEKYVEFWKHKITKSPKLSFFCQFKKDYKLEDYLNFSKFRISNHKLEIEYGRYIILLTE
jgi:hypothetical protein